MEKDIGGCTIMTLCRDREDGIGERNYYAFTHCPQTHDLPVHIRRSRVCMHNQQQIGR